MPTTDVNLNNLVFHDIPRNIYDTITPEANQIYFVEENKTVEERVADVLNNYTPTANLANVALSGEYSDLLNTPTIPVVDATYNALSSNAQSGIAVESAFNSKFVVTNAKPSVTDPNTFYFITEE